MQLCCQTTWSAVIFSGRQMACSGRVRPTETRAHVAVRNPALGPPPKCIELPSAPRGLCARAVTEQFASWGRQGHKVSGAATVPKLSTRWHRAASRPPRPLRLAASQNVSRVAMLSANKDFDVVRSREHAFGRHACAHIKTCFPSEKSLPPNENCHMSEQLIVSTSSPDVIARCRDYR